MTHFFYVTRASYRIVVNVTTSFVLISRTKDLNRRYADSFSCVGISANKNSCRRFDRRADGGDFHPVFIRTHGLRCQTPNAYTYKEQSIYTYWPRCVLGYLGEKPKCILDNQVIRILGYQVVWILGYQGRQVVQAYWILGFQDNHLIGFQGFWR